MSDPQKFDWHTWRKNWAGAIGVLPNERAVMNAYETYFNGDGTGAYPSVATLAEWLQLDRKRLVGERGAIAGLVRKGWLIRTRPATPKSPAHYRVGTGAYRPRPDKTGTKESGVAETATPNSPEVAETATPEVAETATRCSPTRREKNSSSPSSLNSPAAAVPPQPRDVAPGTTSPTRNQPRNDDDESTPQPPNDLTNIPWPTEPTHDPDATPPPPEDDSNHTNTTITSQAALEEGVLQSEEEGPSVSVGTLSGEDQRSESRGPVSATSGGGMERTSGGDDTVTPEPFQQLLAMWPNPRAKTKGSIPLAADEWDTTTKTHQPHTLLTAARAGIADRTITTSTFINAWLRDYAATAVHAQPVFVCVVCRDRGFVRDSWSVDGQPVKAYPVACPGCATKPAPGVTVCVRPAYAKGSLELVMSA